MARRPYTVYTMPFPLARLVALRPYLYHLTAAANVPRICRLRQLVPAADLFRLAGAPERIPERRPALVPLTIAGEPVVLRDQKPLLAERITFTGGWDLSRLVAHLNARVFFWPGDERGPIDSGRRHFAAYANAGEAVLRLRTADVLAGNRNPGPLFCRFNSGAPGRFKEYSPRGPDLFQAAEVFPGGAGAVKEVTFAAGVRLPDGVEVGDIGLGEWRPLFGDAGGEL